MEKSYIIANGTNGFESKYTQAWMEEGHLQLRHLTQEGEELTFEVQPESWVENGKTREGRSNKHIIRLWIDPEEDTHIFITPEKEKKEVKKLW